MAHHLDTGADASWTDAFRNVQLIRDPAEVVASYVRSREACEPEDIGLLQQQWLLERWDAAGLDVPVIDSADFLRDPEAHLRWLCDWLGIEFTDRMLELAAGPARLRRRLGAATGTTRCSPRPASRRTARARSISPSTTPRWRRPAGRRTTRCTSGGCGCSAGHSRLRSGLLNDIQ